MSHVARENTRQPHERAERPASFRGALAALSLAVLQPSLGTSIANVGLPTMAQAFHASFQEVQWVVLGYLLAITTLVVGAGRLGDLIGRRRLLLSGILLYTFASALCAFSPTLGLLVGARGVQGVGAAPMMALTLALAGAAVPPAQTGRAMGLMGTMSAVGTALGPSLGGVLIAQYGWPSIFLVNVPLGLLTWVLVLRHLPPDHQVPRSDLRSYDVLGTVLLALTLAAYALALTVGRNPLAPLNLGLLAWAALGAGLFVAAEVHAPSPLIRLPLLRDRRLRVRFATSMVTSAVVMTTLVVGPFYLSGALGLQPAQVGLVLSVGPLVAALGGMPAGRLVDRFGAPAMVPVGLLGMTVGSLALALPGSHGVLAYIGSIAVITAGYALFQAANNTAVMHAGPSDQRGVVSGMLNLSRNLGLITGTSVMGAVFASASGLPDLAAGEAWAIAAGMRATYMVAAVALVAAFTLAIGRGQAVARPPASEATS